MASAKRIIIGNANTADDWIPYIGDTVYYAYVGGTKIPHWTTVPTQPATKFSSQPSGSTGTNGGYTANGYTIYCSSTYDASSYGAWRAFNGKNTDAYGWATKSNDTSPWIAIKMPMALKNIKVTIKNRVRDSLVNGPKAGGIYGLDSITGTQTLLKSFSGQSGTISENSFTIDCQNYNDAYQIVMIKLTDWGNSNLTNGNQYCSIGEIEINGKEAT